MVMPVSMGHIPERIEDARRQLERVKGGVEHLQVST